MTSTSSRKSIPLSVPSIRGNAWAYLKNCLDDNWVSSAGPYVERFEKAVAGRLRSGHAVACSSGTTALHTALLLAGVGPGDEVLVPTVTFIATVNAVRYVGANPVFMDCDQYYNIDGTKVVEFLATHTDSDGKTTYNRRNGRRIAAIVPVHVFGNAVNLDVFLEECRARSIVVVEDAAEAIGTEYAEGRLAGRSAGTIGRLGVLSFNGNKIVTCGGGGMILTDDPTIAARARYLTTQAKDDQLYFVHNEVGYNYRMTNLQAALGLSQLEVLDEFLRTKRANYDHYKERLGGMPGLVLAGVPPYARNNYWMYCLQLGPDFPKSRDAVLWGLKACGIEARPVWNPNHLQVPYRDCETFVIEEAIDLHARTVNVPCSTGLSTKDVDYVVECLLR